MARDYYSVLVRAVSALDPNTPEQRDAVYDRARSALAEFGLGTNEARDAQVALEAAIRRVESEQAAGRQHAVPQGPGVSSSRTMAPAAANDKPTPSSDERPRSFRPRKELLVAVTLLILGIVGYLLWPRSAVETGNVQAVAPLPVDVAQIPTGSNVRASRDSFVFDRQLVFYRTVHPIGTVVIAKSQGFLYLVRPNNSALRYTVEVGRQCANLAGLLLVSAKEDWNSLRGLDVRSAEQNKALPVRQFGARSLALADTGHRIQGTDGQTAGEPSRCFVLIEDDIIDLYDRVAIGARVVMN